MSFPIAHHASTAPAQHAGGATKRVAPRLRRRLWQRVWLTWVASWRAASLDRELATGSSPLRSAALEARAQRITSRRGRSRVADGLVRAGRDAETATAGASAAVSPDQREVLAAGAVLAAIDRRLRAPEPVTAKGMAQLLLLLTDGESELYRRSERGALASRLRAAAAALEPADQCAQPAATPATPQEVRA